MRLRRYECFNASAFNNPTFGRHSSSHAAHSNPDEGITIDAFRDDWQRQWLVERGVEIISEASRHLPEEFRARHPTIPWREIAGIGNILRHSYENIAAPVIWAMGWDDLPPLEQVAHDQLANAKAGTP